MSSKNCASCNELREVSPEFVLNGVTDTIAENLETNEGLTADDKRDDCDDLHDINDCLIGNMEDELDAYDVCEWKDFMSVYIPNDYETNKAIIESTCGLWDRTDELCEMISNTLNPPLKRYGVLPYMESYPQRNIGSIGRKSGSPLMTVHPKSEISAYQVEAAGVGLNFASKTYEACGSDSCQTLEWITPFFYEIDISSNVENGDVLWYATKADVMEVSGMSDYFWYTFTISSHTWNTVQMAPSHLYGWVNLTVDPGGMGENYIGLVWRGTSYPNNDDWKSSTNQLTYGSNANAVIYRHKCDWVRP